MRFPLPALCLACSLLAGAGTAHAYPASTPSELSSYPLAAISNGGSEASAGLVILPPALSIGGAMLVVRGVEASQRGTALLLERASDGARASVEVTGRSSVAVGASLKTTAIAAGMVLSAAGQVVAFIPNEVGRALLHNEVVVR